MPKTPQISSINSIVRRDSLGTDETGAEVGSDLGFALIKEKGQLPYVQVVDYSRAAPGVEGETAADGSGGYLEAVPANSVRQDDPGRANPDDGSLLDGPELVNAEWQALSWFAARADPSLHSSVSRLATTVYDNFRQSITLWDGLTAVTATARHARAGELPPEALAAVQLLAAKVKWSHAWNDACLMTVQAALTGIDKEPKEAWALAELASEDAAHDADWFRRVTLLANEIEAQPTGTMLGVWRGKADL
ncbi:hypothetical protein Q5752_000227 [Cryptotrichosporon argae]